MNHVYITHINALLLDYECEHILIYTDKQMYGRAMALVNKWKLIITENPKTVSSFVIILSSEWNVTIKQLDFA